MRPPSPTPAAVDLSHDNWPVVRPARLETERLLLRPWRDADLAPFAALNADPRVMEHFPSVLDRLDSDAAAARFRAAYARRGYGLFALEVKGGAPFIGFAGLAPAPGDLPFAPAMEIGWRLAAEHWGAGYATEAARAVLAFAFARLRLPELVSFTVPANLRSIAVMRKIGLVRDEGADFVMPARRPGRVPRPHVLHRLRNPEV